MTILHPPLPTTCPDALPLAPPPLVYLRSAPYPMADCPLSCPLGAQVSMPWPGAKHPTHPTASELPHCWGMGECSARLSPRETAWGEAVGFGGL